MTGWRKRQIQEKQEELMTFQGWWEQLTKAERKMIGETNAQFVWEECQKYTLMTIEDACKAQVAYDQGFKDARERQIAHMDVHSHPAEFAHLTRNDTIEEVAKVVEKVMIKRGDTGHDIARLVRSMKR